MSDPSLLFTYINNTMLKQQPEPRETPLNTDNLSVFIKGFVKACWSHEEDLT